MSPFDCLVLVL